MEGALQSVQDFLGGKWQAFLTASESQTHVHVHDTSFLTHNIDPGKPAAEVSQT